MLSRFSHVQLFATPWTVALQAPLSVGFPRQEYWSGLPFPFSGDLPPGIKPAVLMSLHWQAHSLPLAPPGTHWNVIKNTENFVCQFTEQLIIGNQEIFTESVGRKTIQGHFKGNPHSVYSR